MDLNMLTADFYVVLTTSRIGSKYDDLFSQTISRSLVCGSKRLELTALQASLLNVHIPHVRFQPTHSISRR